MAETIYYVDTDVVGGAGDGSSWANAYSSLNAAEQARDADITGGNAVAFCCRGATNADTAAVSVSGWTTDSDSYVNIYTDQANRHDGKWNTAKYRLTVTDAIALNVGEEYVRIDGLQIQVLAPTATNKHGITAGGVGAANDIRLSNLILRGHNTSGYSHAGIAISDTDLVASIWNCVVYDVYPASGYRALAVTGSTTVAVYSCTIIGGEYALRASSGVVTVKNTYCGGSLTEDFNRSAGTLAKTNCASEDASADDTSGSDETQSNCIISKALDTDTFVNVTAGSEDFHLAADGLSPLQGAGTDTSGESAPLNFTTDIDGETRDATWDIGADAWVVSSVTKTPTVGTVTLTGLAPTLSLAVAKTPTVGAVTLTGLAPTLNVQSAYTPTVGAVTFTGLAPTLSLAIAKTPTVGTVAFTGLTPTLSVARLLMQLGISLPVASNFSVAESAAGIASSYTLTGIVVADPTNNRLELQVVPDGNDPLQMRFTVTYQVE